MKIALLGYGKMGKTIEELALGRGHEVVLRVNSENAGLLQAEHLKEADVAIEFSRPETAFANIKSCLEMGVPVVSGTTAWLDQLEEAKALCSEKEGALFYASNFSIGVNLFFRLSRQLAKWMDAYPSYGVRMEEVHHKQKLDYPSGTAITLAEGILQGVNRLDNWSGTLKGASGGEEKQEKEGVLKIESVREEGVPGTHVVSWESVIDSIEITHTAHSRKGFAEGALTAAEWLVGRKGFFGMGDMLGK